MKKAYFVKLVGGDGDLTLKLVDQETWDWINLNESGQPAPRRVRNFIGFNREENVNQWDDILCSQEIRDRIENMVTNNGDEFDGVWLSSGSWDNDRAILAPPLEDNEDDFISYYANTRITLEMIRKAEELGYEVDTDDEYQGVMY